jgi:hypothetical protein
LPFARNDGRQRGNVLVGRFVCGGADALPRPRTQCGRTAVSALECTLTPRIARAGALTSGPAGIAASTS